MSPSERFNIVDDLMDLRRRVWQVARNVKFRPNEYPFGSTRFRSDRAGVRFYETMKPLMF
ncbi:hypothetical protein EBR96_04125 [bacterium]|nr:hypothetical protein [bacterium]